jgi:YD repeat-containing protein
MQLVSATTRRRVPLPILLLTAGVLFLAVAKPATAQSCGNSITLTVGAGDGSSLVNPAETFGVDMSGNLQSWATQAYFTAPSVTFACFPTMDPGTYNVRVYGGAPPNAFPRYYYTSAPAIGAVTCNSSCSPPPCTNTCTGSAFFAVYATQGSISGHVTNADGTPAVGATVTATWNNYAACQSGVSYYAQTDSTGFYTFKPTWTSNNWGLPLFASGPWPVGTGSPLSSVYNVSPDGCGTVANTTVSSSQMSTVNFGPSGPNPSTQQCPAVGKPASVSTGNLFFGEKDGVIPGLAALSFVRTYNSLEVVDGSQAGLFGIGWTHSYEKSLSFPAPGQIMLREGNGVPLYFQNGQPVIPVTEQSSFAQSGSSYVRSFRAGGSETYDSLGRLTSTVDPSGNVTTLTRDGSGHLTTITDPGSRALTLTYSGSQVSSLVGPGGVTMATYTYYPSPSNLLKSVTYGDGSGYTFAYTSGNQLSTVTDNGGVVLETHTYTADGKAATSSLSGGQEQYTLSYSAGQTTVTDSLGNTTTYQFTTIAGMSYPTAISGPCASCGGGKSNAAMDIRRERSSSHVHRRRRGADQVPKVL